VEVYFYSYSLKFCVLFEYILASEWKDPRSLHCALRYKEANDHNGVRSHYGIGVEWQRSREGIVSLSNSRWRLVL
jgi:hypothetical protein